jgi:hypothetical protein
MRCIYTVSRTLPDDFDTCSPTKQIFFHSPPIHAPPTSTRHHQSLLQRSTRDTQAKESIYKLPFHTLLSSLLYIYPLDIPPKGDTEQRMKIV